MAYTKAQFTDIFWAFFMGEYILTSIEFYDRMTNMSEEEFKFLYNLIIDYRFEVDEDTFYQNLRPSSPATPDGLFYDRKEMNEFFEILEKKNGQH